MNSAETSIRQSGSRRWRNALVLSALAGLLLASFASLTGDWASLFSWEALKMMSTLVVSFFPPAMDAPFL